MRISDWSSDVCSSDLVMCSIGVGYRRGNGCWCMVGRVASGQRLFSLAVPGDARCLPLLVRRINAVFVKHLVTRGLLKIGSASWRERVCQYVEILVVACTLHTKQRINRVYEQII